MEPGAGLRLHVVSVTSEVFIDGVYVRQQLVHRPVQPGDVSYS